MSGHNVLTVSLLSRDANQDTGWACERWSKLNFYKEYRFTLKVKVSIENVAIEKWHFFDLMFGNVVNQAINPPAN